MSSFLANTWPVLMALALVGAITYGATMPYVRKERRRREEEDKNND